MLDMLQHAVIYMHQKLHSALLEHSQVLHCQVVTLAPAQVCKGSHCSVIKGNTQILQSLDPKWLPNWVRLIVKITDLDQEVEGLRFCKHHLCFSPDYLSCQLVYLQQLDPIKAIYANIDVRLKVCISRARSS